MADIEKLRRRYDNLTAFERAALRAQEAIGERRLEEMEALLAPTVQQAFLTQAWNYDFFATAAVAMFRSAQYAYIGVIGLHHARDEKELLLALETAQSGAAWIRALSLLADATGAPLMECARMIGSEWVHRQMEDSENCDCRREYESLRILWQGLTDGCNERDAHRSKAPSYDEIMVKA